MSLKHRRITVRITLVDPGTFTPSQTSGFEESGTNTVELSGYRVAARIAQAGGASQGQAQFRIFGLSRSLMNQLSSLGKTPVVVRKNIVSILAGDDDGVSLVFTGTTSQAYADMSGAPEAALVVSASALLFEAVQTIPPTSFKGAVSAAVIMKSLADAMNKPFENYGVDVTLSDRYYGGSALTQFKQVVEDANCEWNGGDAGRLVVWPKGSSMAGDPVEVSARTGMVGYPYPSGEGYLGVRSIFNPAIRFGRRINVISDITPACGIWVTNQVVHEIASEMPGGEWFTSIMARPLIAEIVPGAAL
jgi:hypothetical protein